MRTYTYMTRVGLRTYTRTHTHTHTYPPTDPQTSHSPHPTPPPTPHTHTHTYGSPRKSCPKHHHQMPIPEADGFRTSSLIFGYCFLQRISVGGADGDNWMQTKAGTLVSERQPRHGVLSQYIAVVSGQTRLREMCSQQLGLTSYTTRLCRIYYVCIMCIIYIYCILYFTLCI